MRLMYPRAVGAHFFLPLHPEISPSALIDSDSSDITGGNLSSLPHCPFLPFYLSGIGKLQDTLT